MVNVHQPESAETPSATTRATPLSDVGSELISGIVEAAPDGIVMIDESGTIVLVNRQTEELFGYDRGELLGKPVEQLMPERYRQVHGAHRTRYRVEPRTRPMGAGLSLLGRRSDGTEFPIEISLSPLDADGVSRAIAVVRDITERLQAEAETRRVLALLDSTRDGVFIFDVDTLRFSYVNDGAVDQVGYSHDELLEMTPLHIAPEFTESAFRELLAEIEASGGSRSRTVTTVHRRRDGRDIAVELLLQASTDEDPEHPTSFVVTVRDIQERLEAERLLHEAAESLRLLGDRERIARDLHDLVIQRLFAAGMALQATISRLGDREIADRVVRVVDDLDDTIRQLRTVIFGLQDHRDERASIRSNVIEIVSEERAALGFEPQIGFDGPVDSIGDAVADQLLAVLREALSNVARHAHATSAQVNVAADARALTLQVIDDGIGIADAPSEGNGLRNARVRAIALGGTFTVTTAPSGGTIFEWRVAPLS